MIPIGAARAGVLSSDAIPDSGDLQARYDATEISASDGDAISTWSDETLNGHDLTAGTAPTYQTSVINGNPVVRFNGSDQYLDVGFGSTVSKPTHLFGVFVLRSQNTTFAYMADGFDSNNEQAFVENGSDSWGAFGSNGITGGNADTSAHIVSILFDGPNSHLRIDGTQVASGDTGTDAVSGVTLAVRADQGNWGPVDWGEYWMYPTDKSSVESDAENYLSNKWGIAV